MQEFYINVTEEISIKIITFMGGGEPVYFIPGWIVDLMNFLPTINVIVQAGYDVYYFEMRDKKSANYSRKETSKDFLIDRFSEDLNAVVEKFDHDKFHLISSSLGAQITMRYLANPNYRRPVTNIFIIPAIEIIFPGWQKIFIRTPLIFNGFIVRVVEWYMKRKFVHEDEPENAYKFSEKLYEIDMKRVQLFALAMDKTGGINIKNFHELIKDEILIIGAENDLLHPEGMIEQFAMKFEKGRYVNLYSNKYTHGEFMGRLAVKYFRQEDYSELLLDIKL